jgi:hypothetical protein
MEITTKDIRNSFYELSKILEKLNNTVSMINEKYGEENAKLFEAGFWDKLKTGASKVGSAVGNVAGNIKNTVSDIKTGVNNTVSNIGTGVNNTISNIKTGINKAYDKGAELGNKALTYVKEIGTKIMGYFTQAWAWISEQPEKFWNTMTSAWNAISDEIIKLKKQASNRFKLNMSLILDDINKKLCRKLRELVGSTNPMQTGPYAIARKRPADFKGKYEKFKGTLMAVAKELIKSEYKNAKEFGQKLLATLQKDAKDVGVFIVGLIVAPFYAAGWATKKLYNIGVNFGEAIDKFITTAKSELPEIWNSFKTGATTAYQTKTNTSVQEPQLQRENKILKFKDFVNEKSERRT